MSGRALFLVFLVLLACRVHADGNCRVMADCDETLQWKQWQSGSSGKQGERGPPGPKGDPAPAINMTEFLEEFDKAQREKEGPFLHYYTQTITWDSGKAFCRSLNKKLCHSKQLCFRNKQGGRNLIPDVMAGDHWVPVIDDTNEWLEAGDSIGRTCKLHTEEGGPPSWGIETAPKPYKGFVYCCELVDADLEIKYRYIGKTANYQRSKAHCTQQGRRLCFASEVCRNKLPIFGVVGGDHWIAVQDKNNEWVEIGNDAERTCWIHGDHYDPPDWGVRTKGKVKHVGYVLCCPIEPIQS